MNIIEELSDKILKNEELLANFFNQKFSKAPANFYNSVDLRHSGFKIAPVDTNCFPAGFNNLSEPSKKLGHEEIKKFIENQHPKAKKIILIPENHSRNLAYLDNIRIIAELINSAGYEVKIASLIEDITQATKIETASGKSVELWPITKKDQKIFAGNSYEADLIVLNNDLTDGIPEILQNISTPIIPSTKMGWYKRSKSKHFTIYNQLAREVAQIIKIDSWLISSIHQTCHEINFKNQVGLDELANQANSVLEAIKEKYSQHNIKSEPYCYIKADSGTYGMAVWNISKAEEIININKKDRNKMNMLKNSVQNNRVIIQEGIPTIDKIDSKIAEPLIYLINGSVVANLYRVNENRNEKNSLNAAGALFFDSSNLQNKQINHNHPNLTLIYKMITKISALSSSIEVFDNEN